MGTSQRGNFVNLFEPVTWMGKGATVECESLVRVMTSRATPQRELDSDRKGRRKTVVKYTFSLLKFYNFG